MTVDQLFRELQKLKLKGCGDYTVMLSDCTVEPPVPLRIEHVKISEKIKKCYLQSMTLDEYVANHSK